MSFQQAAIFFIVLLCSIALHEFGHAWMADKRGDPLPRAQGRVTLDPFKHLELIGSFVIPGVMIFAPVLFGSGAPFALIGWGRPVQISLPNPQTRRADEILITLAGPAVNLILAVAAAIAIGIAFRVAPPTSVDDLADGPVGMFLIPALRLNVGLLVFNLFPLPPLDGSHLLRYLVGMKDETYLALSRYGFWILLVLINIPGFSEGMFTVMEAVATPLYQLSYFVKDL